MRVALSIVSELLRKHCRRQKVIMKVLEANFHNNRVALMRKMKKMNLV